LAALNDAPVTLTCDAVDVFHYRSGMSGLLRVIVDGHGDGGKEVIAHKAAHVRGRGGMETTYGMAHEPVFG
jgi:hypothetical protein